MKIGDKVRVVETGRVGIILDETAKGWKIDFLDGNKPEFVSKDIALELVSEGGGSSGGVAPGKPKKKKDWFVRIFFALIVIGIGIAIYYIAKGF